MKFTRKLIPALAMLVVSATMTSTASYAWFSMNRTVTATGMQVNAVAPVNLQISTDGTSYSNAITGYTNVTGKLMPASTTDGKTFYAVKEGTGPVINDGNGGAVASTSEVEFQTTSKAVANNVDGYFVDYTFHLQLTSPVDQDTNIYLSNLTFSEATKVLNQAARVALFNNADQLVAIYAATSDTAEAIAELDDDGTIKTLTATDAIAATDDTKVVTIAANQTKTKVTLRLWIEGQDAQCTNANAGSTIDFSIAFSVK